MNASPHRRRDRGALPALSRERVIEAALSVLRSEGLPKVTMRRVAHELDTGQSSLYVYVANTTALHAAMLDELTAGLRAEEGEGWESRLESLLLAYSRVLFAHPGLARSALALRPMGPHTLRLIEQVLELLLEGDVAPERAAWGVDLLLQHVTATAAEHAPPADGGGPAEADEDRSNSSLAVAIREADPGQTPRVAELAEALLSGPHEARERWGIRALVLGIAGTPVARGDSRSPDAGE
jgi:AcrR family transcriptional regulator